MDNQLQNKSMLVISHTDAKKQIEGRIEKAKEILKTKTWHIGHYKAAYNKWEKWKSVTVTILENIFTDSKYADEFSDYVGGVKTMSSSLDENINHFKDELKHDINSLEALIEKLPYIPSRKEKTNSEIPNSNEPVFVVHGHDEEMNQSILRFLERLGLKAIDLREQPGGTLSVREKLEKYSDVKFAVILFTADDLGRLKTVQEESRRNRQNVIYELAGFQKQLGNENVAIIQKEKTELPSDIEGIHHISWYDNYDGWKIRLARELKNAGLKFDFNRVL